MSTQFSPGVHTGCRVVSGVFAQSAKKGTPGMFIDFEIADGCVRTVNLWLSPAAKARSEAILAEIGFNWDYNDPQFDPEKSQNVTLEMRIEDYNGKPQERWEFERGKGYTPAPESLASQFTAEARAKYGAMPKPSNAPTPPPPRNAVGAPPPRAKPYGKNEAWAEYVEAMKAKGKEADGATFNTTIEMVESDLGKPEAKFGAAEWKAVVLAIPPF